jgi:hypothetical protein
MAAVISLYRRNEEILITSTVRDTFCFSRAARSFNYRLAGVSLGEER